MNKLKPLVFIALSFVSLAATVANAQVPVPATTPFTRGFLRTTNQASAQSYLGTGGGGTSTNLPSLVVTNQGTFLNGLAVGTNGGISQLDGGRIFTDGFGDLTGKSLTLTKGLTEGTSGDGFVSLDNGAITTDGNGNLTVGSVTGSFIGNGAQITSLQAGNISGGTVPLAYSTTNFSAASATTMTVSNSLFIGNSTNTPSFTLVNTNWIDGKPYTNTTGRNIFAYSQCTITPGAASSIYALTVGGTIYSQLSSGTEALGTFPKITNSVQFLVTNGGVFAFTNLTGTGSIVAGGYYEVH